MAAKQTYRISIPSRTDDLHKVRTFISDLARAHGFVDDDINKITIAVDEACTNIIKHGYNYSPHHEIEVEVVRNGQQFEILISDNGKQFDPGSVETPDMKEYLSHFRRGGLGLYLMKRIMDKVEFDFNRDRNTLRMIKSL
ncbi:MAG: ATP-binding protein [Ignavibacteriales bacterium]|nr:ATP-binding protein [Ignavibacteriales bacterium]